MSAEKPVCGAAITTKQWQGIAEEQVLCVRREGPCPWVGLSGERGLFSHEVTCAADTEESSR